MTRGCIGEELGIMLTRETHICKKIFLKKSKPLFDYNDFTMITMAL